MKFFTFIIIFLIHIQLINTLLIKSNEVYENVITSIYNHYECTSVILFHSSTNFEAAQDCELSTKLKNLMMLFTKNFILTIVTDVESYVERNLNNMHATVNNLFVFLDDSEVLKHKLMTQLAPLIDMYRPVWLTFFKDETKIEDFYENFYIPFDCRFMVSQRITSNDKNSEVITEIYRIDEYKELRQDIFGSWSPESGIQLPALSLYKRRNNLYGHVLRVTIIDSPPCSIIEINENNQLQLGGLFGSIMELLQKNMNFTVVYNVVTEFGSHLDNNIWTGGIAALIYNRSDIFPTDLRVVSNRLNFMQFSAPLFMTKDYFFFKKPATTISWKVFFKPFHKNIWIIIVCVILLSSIVSKFIFTFHQRKCSQTKVNLQRFRIPDPFLNVLGAFCNQAMCTSTINSIIIIQNTVHLTALVVIAAYSGVLISSLTINTFEAPFQSLEGFVKDGSYRIGVLGNSAYNDLFQNATDKVIKHIYENKIRSEISLPQSVYQGIKRVCNEDKYAFLSSNPPTRQLELRQCVLFSSEAILMASVAIGLQKNCPFRGLMNINLHLFRDYGILEKLTRKWLPVKPYRDDNKYTPVQLNNVIPLIIFLVGSCFISIFFLYCEKLISKKMKERRARQFLKIKLSSRLRLNRRYKHLNLIYNYYD